jgi:hypothetical protein
LQTRRSAEGRLFTRDDLRAAIMAGAVERVRPKMMTVFAIMAGLLPISIQPFLQWDGQMPIAFALSRHFHQLLAGPAISAVTMASRDVPRNRRGSARVIGSDGL